MGFWLSNHVRAGSISLIGMRAWCTYVVLRDYVWRSSNGSSALKDAKSESLVVASIRIDRIAEQIGANRKTIQSALRVLKEAGWIEVRSNSGRSSIYVLGRVENGKEVYFADQMTQTGNDLPENPGQVKNGLPGRSKTAQVEGTDLGQKRSRGWVKNGLPGSPKMTQGVGKKRSTLINNREQPIENNQQEQPTGRSRKVKRIVKKTSKPSPPHDAGPREVKKRKKVEVEGRMLDPEEARVLRSAQAKYKKGSKDYSGEEQVAAWRHRFFLAFDHEDPDLGTKASRTRAARLITTRVTRWAGGDRARFNRFLNDQIRLWRDKREGADFPPGQAPRLVTTLLKDTKEGPSWFWREWTIGSKRKRSARG